MRTTLVVFLLTLSSLIQAQATDEVSFETISQANVLLIFEWANTAPENITVTEDICWNLRFVPCLSSEIYTSQETSRSITWNNQLMIEYLNGVNGTIAINDTDASFEFLNTASNPTCKQVAETDYWLQRPSSFLQIARWGSSDWSETYVICWSNIE